MSGTQYGLRKSATERPSLSTGLWEKSMYVRTTEDWDERPPGRVRTLKDMTPEEREKLSRELGAPISVKALEEEPCEQPNE